MGHLMAWEFEWFKAFHLLRDGEQLPSRAPDELMDPAKVDARIEVLKRLPLEKIVDAEPPPKLDEEGVLSVHRILWNNWAEGHRWDEIADIRNRKPRDIRAKRERQVLWKALWSAKTTSTLRAACNRWSRLPDVRGLGFGVFPEHVRAYEKQFLAITSHGRFPKSLAADDSRMDYLARGMAGVMVEVSPMTGIERLRNMNHGPGGPLWSKESNRCACWRCVVAHWNALEERAGNENE